MAYVLDAGALIAAERHDARLVALLAAAAADGAPLRVPAAVVAQVWRGDARQVRLTRLLRAVEEVSLDAERSRATGALLRRSDTTDVVDASVIELCRSHDVVVTSDVSELRLLARSSGVPLTVVRV